MLCRYKDLKKLLKPRTSADGQAHVVTPTPHDKADRADSGGTDTHPAEDAFFSALQEQMVEVDRYGPIVQCLFRAVGGTRTGRGCLPASPGERLDPGEPEEATQHAPLQGPTRLPLRAATPAVIKHCTWA